jgi:hypothetical protein
MLYLGITNFLFLAGYSLARVRRTRWKIYYLVIFALFLFSAFRYQVGCDWSGYYYQYLNAGTVDWSLFTSDRELLWSAILRWIREAGLPYPVANIVSSAVFFIGVHALARRQPDPLGFLVLLFPILIINMPMSGIRQGAAIGLICIAFVNFTDRRPLWLALWVVLAAGFHFSALVFLLLLPLATGRYTKKRLVMAAILGVPGAILLATSESAALASNRYIETDIEAFGAIFRLGILGLSALYFFLFVRKKWNRCFPRDYSLASIGAIGMLIAFSLLALSSVIGDRFGYYLIPIQAMIFARLPFLPFKSNKALHSILPYLVLALVFLVWTQLSSHFQHCFIPYDTWLFGLPEGSMLR